MISKIEQEIVKEFQAELDEMKKMRIKDWGNTDFLWSFLANMSTVTELGRNGTMLVLKPMRYS